MSESTNPVADSSDNSKNPDEASRLRKDGQPEDRLDAAKRIVDRAYLEFGRELYLEFNTDRFRDRGYKSFDDYARHKGIDPGRARRLRRVFKIFQRDLGVPYERIAAIGYESATAIIPVITKANKEDWLKKAADLSYSELIKLVDMRRPPKKKRQVVVSTPGSQPQSYKPEGSAKLAARLAPPQVRPSVDGKTEAVGDDDIVYEKTLYLVGDQNSVFETALESVERRTGSDKVGYLLTCALMEFLAIEAVKDTKDDGRMKYFMSILESRYGGRLMWVKDKKVAESLNELIERAEADTGQGGEGPPPIDGSGGVHPLPIQQDPQAPTDRPG